MKRLIGILLLLSMLSGCAGTEYGAAQSADFTIGVVVKGMDSPHWLDVRSGLSDAARENNVNVLVLYPAKEDEADEQAHMFRDLVARAPDAILFAPCDSENCGELIDLAASADIPLITIDTAANEGNLPYVGADNLTIGRMAATRLAGQAKQSGKLTVIAGVETQSSHADRVEGFRLTAEGYPDVTVAGVYRADSDFQRAMDCMEQIMREHPDVEGVFCTSAVMALGAAEQLRAGGYTNKPRIVGVDTQDDALAALRTGVLDGLVTQDGYECGYKAVEYAVSMLRGESIADRVYIDTTLQTQGTVDELIEARAARKGGKT